MWRRPFLVVTAVACALGLGAFVVALFVTSDLTEVAQGFFSSMASGDFDGAYDYLSQEFHGNTSVAELKSFAQESALAEYREAEWWHRSVSGDAGMLDGQIETRAGDTIPVTMYLLREDGEWRIYQIDWGADADTQEEASPGTSTDRSNALKCEPPPGRSPTAALRTPV
ncbi:MAG: hypothetical protein ACFFEK_16540 [Candidatus Thorarchaeota archaeon]